MNNEDKMVSLKDVVTAFDAPISEEHAWALIYEGFRKMMIVANGTQRCYLTKKLEHVILASEGVIHDQTFLGTGQDADRFRPPLTSLASGIAEFAVVVYDALDWNLPFERDLEEDLEALIDRMTSADDSDQQDEGIGIGMDEEIFGLHTFIMDSCRKHCKEVSSEEPHHHFKSVCRDMVKEVEDLSSLMSRMGREELQELEEEERRNLLGVFSTVMEELSRSGVTLKKVQTKEIEPLLSTPHELLMADIRSKKAALKPSVALPLSSAELAPRDKLMDFIKSKPQLRPASERVLASPVIAETPVEKLMSDIRTGKARQSLRRTRSRVKTSTFVEAIGKISAIRREDCQPGKKVLGVDDVLHSSLINFDTSPENSGDEDGEVFQAGAGGRPPSSSDSLEIENSLTLAEVSHICEQMKMAELDETDLNNVQREEISKGKICFNCVKTKFNWITWSYTCQICRKKVCKNCCAKIDLPNRNLGDVFVSSLFDQFEEEEDLDDEKSESQFDRLSASRGSLKCLQGSSLMKSPSLMKRSKTLSRTEATQMQKKALSVHLSVIQEPNCTVSSTICLACKTLLANDLWAKKSPRSPKKRSIRDIKTKTISKRKLFKLKENPSN